MVWAPLHGVSTNDLPFPCSYMMNYHQFYYTDVLLDPKLAVRKLPQVGHPTQKAIVPCFAMLPGLPDPYRPAVGNENAHGKGMALLFVDGHSEYAKYARLIKDGTSPFPSDSWTFDLNWTYGGLPKGMDLR
jgi:prepilin-type processing-associated H-X9-DG protein